MLSLETVATRFGILSSLSKPNAGMRRRGLGRVGGPAEAHFAEKR